MLLHIPDVLNAQEVAECRDVLDRADWEDGRATAGHLSASVKRNQQLHWRDPVALQLGATITERLQSNPMFLSAALPQEILPPLFNRYEGGGHYGPHLDGAIRPVEGTARRIRTDLSLTLMLSEPAQYDGGELVISDMLEDRVIKLPAGHAILYPGTSIHHIAPVTRGVRLAAFTWVQSLVRDEADRALLFELDTAIQRLPQAAETDISRLQFSNVYHNLVRKWAGL